ncbi:7279_t:CDS:2 [Entrophospora sp. SA101]|nr:7279_t:CDS:2 [Entrophospora sp. SA101]
MGDVGKYFDISSSLELEKHGQDWNKISGIIKNKTPLECLKKYQELLPNKFEPIIAKSEQRTALSKIPDEGIIIPGWTKQEFELVNELLDRHGRRWSVIQKHLPHKTIKQIEYFVLKNPNRFPALYKFPEKSIRSSRWSNSEIALLNELILKYGRDYDVMSKYILGRTPDAISRFIPKHIYELPALREVHLAQIMVTSCTWTDEEKKLLSDLVEKHGQNWQRISEHFPGRTPYACEIKYYTIWDGVDKNTTALVKHSWPIEAIKAFNIIREKCGRWELIPLLLPGFSPLLCFSPYTTIPHRWTKSDKILLKNLISKYGFDWYKIIPFFPHRNSAEVQQYVAKNISLFQDNDDGGNKLKKKISKDKGSGKYSTRWKIDKIIKLFELRNLGKSWKDISKVMKDRTPSGCYLKYYSVLKIYSELELSKKWDVMDVIKFQKYYYKYNRNWELISEQMGNKSVKQIKDFFTNNKNRFPNFITSKSLKKKEWSEEEIIKLVGLLKEFGTNWKLISKHFEKKSKIECIEFYNSNHDSLPQITNTNDIVASTSEKWTKKDDNMLKSLLEEHGTDYDKIASYFIVTTTIWSDYDENRLIDLINLYGNNWEKISTIFGDRSPNACSEKYHSIVNPMIERTEIYQ